MISEAKISDLRKGTDELEEEIKTSIEKFYAKFGDVNLDIVTLELERSFSKHKIITGVRCTVEI